MLSAMRSLSMVKRMIMITGTGDHDRPEWLIIITGIRSIRTAVEALPFWMPRLSAA
jgi:hypothetical protein